MFLLLGDLSCAPVPLTVRRAETVVPMNWRRDCGIRRIGTHRAECVGDHGEAVRTRQTESAPAWVSAGALRYVVELLVAVENLRSDRPKEVSALSDRAAVRDDEH